MVIKHFCLIIGVLVCFWQTASAQDIDSPEFLLSEAIRYNTVNNPPEEKKLGNLLGAYASSKGLFVKDFSNSDTSTLLMISLLPFETEKKSVVLLSHLDVVEATNEYNEWSNDPFAGVIKNDTIWGRGAIDMKGISVMQLFSLIKLKEDLKDSLDNLSYNIVVLLVGNEELGGAKGSEIVCNLFFHELKPAVVLGEGGAGLSGIIPGKPNQQVFFVSVAEKRNLWLKLESKVKTHGHASVPSDKSANKILLKAITKIDKVDDKIKLDKVSKNMFKRLGEITGGAQGFILKHINWWVLKPFRKKILMQNELFLPMVTNTFTLTKIYNPPGAINQITQESSAYYDCRLLPRYNEKIFTLRRLTRILDPRIKLTVVSETPEASSTKPDKFYRLLEKSIKYSYTGAEVVPYMFVASSDNSYFRSCGIPTYGLMPIKLSRELIESVNAPNERISIQSLHQGIAVYYHFIKSSSFYKPKRKISPLKQKSSKIN
ncbi:MAG: M20/M25/M40 family metallo-hydrolase [Bacteroidia bacterium]|nr:M20/M25/M40 family metallo-hydrolase [Bacteroidia bacterium]